jgi:putative exporter of polyketide antibiotics
VSVTAGAAIGLYVLSFVAPALDWPQWVLDLNPFLQLGNAPVVAVHWPSIVVLCALALLAAVTGFITYRTRDLV